MELIDEFFAGAVKVLRPAIFEDQRGLFLESYNKKTMEKVGVFDHFVQDNRSLTLKKGSLRGLHFQIAPMAQSKLISVSEGKILDIIVDLRANSATYRQWKSVELSAENFYQVYMGKGMAHGFCTLTDRCYVHYKADNFYSPKHSSGVLWNDSLLNIDWPTKTPLLSEQDKSWQTLEENKVLL